MFSRILIFAVGIISALSEPIYIERRTSDSDYIVTCLMEGFLKVRDELDAEGGHAPTDEAKLKCFCDFISVRL